MNRKTLIYSGIAVALAGSMSFAYTLGRHSAQPTTQPSTSVPGTFLPAEDEQLREANQILLEATVNNTVSVRHETTMPSIRKDTWVWFWNEKAHLDIDPQDKTNFWGNTIIGQWMKTFTESMIIPGWNAAMEYDIVRGIFLLFASAYVLTVGCVIIEDFCSCLDVVGNEVGKSLAKKITAMTSFVKERIGKPKKA
jgi:hypothetical protein